MNKNLQTGQGRREAFEVGKESVKQSSHKSYKLKRDEAKRVFHKGPNLRSKNEELSVAVKSHLLGSLSPEAISCLK